MKLFICFYNNRKIISDNVVSGKFHSSAVPGTALISFGRNNITANYSGRGSRDGRENVTLWFDRCFNSAHFCNAPVKFCYKDYSIYNRKLCSRKPLSMIFVYGRDVVPNYTISQSLTTKSDSKHETKISAPQVPPLTPPPPKPVPTPSMQPQAPATQLPPLSQKPLPSPAEFPSEAKFMKREEVKRSITLAELTDVDKKDVSELKSIVNHGPALKRPAILTKIVDELKHYYHGFRLLFIDIRISVSLLFRVLRGHTLRRREKNLLRRTVGDVFRLIPFSVFIVVPFMELLLPVFIKLFPGMLPSTFQSKADKEDKARQKLKVKLEMAKFLQGTLYDIAVVGKPHCLQCAEDVKAFSNFFEKVRSGKEMPSNQEILKFSHLFNDSITLDSMSRPQLVALCRVLEISPFGTTAFLRFQIEMRLRSIHADDQVIMKEGVDSLDLLELQQACQTRGMRALGVPEEVLRAQLKQWIDLTMNSKVPETLLFLSRAFMLHDGPKDAGAVATTQQIGEAISALPESVAVIATEQVGQARKLRDPKKEIELIKEQFEMIKEERKEEKAERERLEAASKEDTVETKVDDSKQQYPFIKGEPVEVDGLLVCRPVAKQPDVITSGDAKTIQAAVEELSQEILPLEKQELEKLKDKLEDYKQDFKTLEQSPSKVDESKAAKRLYKYTKHMTEKLDKSIAKIEQKDDTVKKDMSSEGPPGEIRKKLLQIEELVKVIEGLQKASAKPDQKLQTICEILSKMATDNVQEYITLETLMKVMELVQDENVNLTPEQMEELIQTIKKEEIISLHEQIEKTLQNKYSDCMANKPPFKFPEVNTESTRDGSATPVENVKLNQETSTSPAADIKTNPEASKTPVTNVNTNKDASKTPETNANTNKDASKTPETNVNTNKGASKTPETNVNTNKDASKTPETNVNTNKDASKTQVEKK